MTQHFSSKFKSLRKAADLTQEAAADIFRVSPQTISRWETGANFPDVAMLPHIAIYFKVTVDELLGTEAIRTEADAQGYMADIRNLLNSGNIDKAIAAARLATKAYPLNTNLQYLLVQALQVRAVQTAEGSDDEIIAISKRLISLTDYKTSLPHRVQLIRHYARLNQQQQAQELLDTLPAEIWDSQEPWRGLVLEGAVWLENQRHSIFRASMLLDYLIGGYAHNADISPAEKIECIKAQMQIADIVGGITRHEPQPNHLELALANINIAQQYAEMGDMKSTLSHIESATESALYHIDQMDETGEDGSNYLPWPTTRNLPWILQEDYLARPQFDSVRGEAKFAKCLETLVANSRELRPSK